MEVKCSRAAGPRSPALRGNARRVALRPVPQSRDVERRIRAFPRRAWEREKAAKKCDYKDYCGKAGRNADVDYDEKREKINRRSECGEAMRSFRWCLVLTIYLAGCHHVFHIATDSVVRTEGPIATRSHVITESLPVNDGGPIVEMPLGGPCTGNAPKVAVVDVDS